MTVHHDILNTLLHHGIQKIIQSRKNRLRFGGSANLLVPEMAERHFDVRTVPARSYDYMYEQTRPATRHVRH